MMATRHDGIGTGDIAVPSMDTNKPAFKQKMTCQRMWQPVAESFTQAEFKTLHSHDVAEARYLHGKCWSCFAKIVNSGQSHHPPSSLFLFAIEPLGQKRFDLSGKPFIPQQFSNGTRILHVPVQG